ncbi:hypothetical protein OEZ85_001110 [Tetradesmus obliquus]|uniref:Anaphase-promoting complex subunit 4 WD40 domain-containing protein n=1 Tax=Tetradesmus obliquus TaxID=3088 RepID=A0ABY8UME7_TETOB|nr:hypothetical protein OEZ85_001110 [Tetradesmus obliquus]
MYNAAASNGANKPKKERKLTVIFKHTTADQHVAGVEALAVAPDSSSLYTASRDSLVKRWHVGSAAGSRPQCSGSFEGHIDWVNDVLLYQDKLVSCSSDRTVKIWQAGEEVRCLHTVQHHSDYVTCLAASEAAGKLVSAGLRSEVITYDMQTLQAHLLMPYPSSSSSGSAASSTTDAAGSADAAAAAAAGGGGQPPQAPMRSVYALAMSSAGTLVAAGTTEAYIRLLDPRSGQKVMKLKGHTDNVRALLLNEEGTLLLSGSSDNTVRLWDLGQQRCVQTLNVHTDSVWCLAASPDFSVVYSGGRDQCLYATHMARRKAWLLAREPQPIRSIALANCGTRLWVSTTLSSVHGYDIPFEYCGTAVQQQQQQQQHSGQLPAADGSSNGPAAERLGSSGSSSAAAAAAAVPAGGRTLSGSASGRAVIGSSPSMRLRGSFDPGAGGEVPLLSPSVCIDGALGLVALPVLSNKRHVLTRDSNPPRARPSLFPLYCFGICAGLVALRVLSDKRHVLTRDSAGHVQLWDVLAGQPIQQLGQVDIADMERRLFRPLYVESWFTADIKLGALALNLEPPKCFAAECYALDLGVRDVPDDQKVNLGACLLRTALSKWAHEFSRLHMSGAPLPGLDDPGADQLPHFSDQLPPAVVSTDASGTAWRLGANAFTGREREGEHIPPWVAEAVLRGLLPYVKELKSAFVLLPAEGSGLPSLLQSRLNAPRILQVMKVANYCATKLAELNVPLATHEVGLSPDSQQPPENSGKQFLELTCNGLAVPYSMSLATIKKFIWKRSDDVVFHYRTLDPARLAPFPNFQLPEA